MSAEGRDAGAVGKELRGPHGTAWQSQGADLRPRSRVKPRLDPGGKACIMGTWTSDADDHREPVQVFPWDSGQWEGERGGALSDKIREAHEGDEAAQGSWPGRREARRAALEHLVENVCGVVCAMHVGPQARQVARVCTSRWRLTREESRSPRTPVRGKDEPRNKVFQHKLMSKGKA